MGQAFPRPLSSLSPHLGHSLARANPAPDSFSESNYKLFKMCCNLGHASIENLQNCHLTRAMLAQECNPEQSMHERRFGQRDFTESTSSSATGSSLSERTIIDALWSAGRHLRTSWIMMTEVPNLVSAGNLGSLVEVGWNGPFLSPGS